MKTKPGADAAVTVLIADDCARMRQAIRSILRDLAGEIYEAADGSGAIAAYRSHKPDWATLDIEMQPVDGLTAAREIRAFDPAARIIIVTAYDTAAFRKAAELAGITRFILKDDLTKIRDVIASAT